MNVGNNTELYELSGRAKALRSVIKSKKSQCYEMIDCSLIEAIMGWDEECCQQCGRPANEQDAEEIVDWRAAGNIIPD